MTNRVAIVCEGYTEQNFVRRVLQKEITDIVFAPVNLRGRRIAADRILDHVRELSHKNFVCITTFVDFYKFKNSGGCDADGIEEEMRKKADSLSLWKTKFLPYVQKHEFEALLFADKEILADYLRLKPAQRKELGAITHAPEDIDHGQSPSNHITRIADLSRDSRSYHKPTDGVEIALRIGLAKIARECPRFGGWLGELKKIARQ